MNGDRDTRNDATFGKRDAGYATAIERCDALEDHAEGACVNGAKMRDTKS